MHRATILSALLAGLVLLGGCDLFSGEEDLTIRASGTVVSAETGTPIEGITVALDEIVGISHVYVEAVRTDGEGRFSLVYDGKESFGYSFVVNESPYNPGYSRFRARLQPGERRDFGVIELEERGD
jgi:hypothetical protein